MKLRELLEESKEISKITVKVALDDVDEFEDYEDDYVSGFADKFKSGTVVVKIENGEMNIAKGIKGINNDDIFDMVDIVMDTGKNEDRYFKGLHYTLKIS